VDGRFTVLESVGRMDALSLILRIVGALVFIVGWLAALREIFAENRLFGRAASSCS